MNEQKNNDILIKALMAKDQLSAIKIYCEERSKFDYQLQKALDDPDKNYDACWKYIMKKAQIYLKNKSGHIMPTIIFGWAVHYFTEPDDVIDDEVSSVQSKVIEFNSSVDSKPTTKQKKEQPLGENKPSFERMSIFDFMDSENKSSDDENIEEEDDE